MLVQKTVRVCCGDPLGFTAQGLEIIQIDEDKKFGLGLGRISGSATGRPFCCGLAENMNNTNGPACGSQSGLMAAMIAEEKFCRFT